MKAQEQAHPLTAAIRRWFHDPAEGASYRGVVRPWGTYWSGGQVYPRDLARGGVGDFVDDLRAYYNTVRVVIMLDDPADVRRLGPTLEAAGCSAGYEDLFLLHDGPWPAGRPAPYDLTIEPVHRRNLLAAVRVRRYGFLGAAGLDNGPALEAEVQQRTLEMQDGAGGLLARVGGEPAGFIWWHAMPEATWVFYLATMPAFQRRGVAGQLLRASTSARQAPALVINVMAGNRPARRLYEKLNFHTVVYRRWRYVLTTTDDAQ